MRGGMNMLAAIAMAACLGVGGGATLVPADETLPRAPRSPRNQGRDPKAPHTGSREIQRRQRQEARNAARAAASNRAAEA